MISERLQRAADMAEAVATLLAVDPKDRSGGREEAIAGLHELRLSLLALRDDVQKGGQSP